MTTITAPAPGRAQRPLGDCRICGVPAVADGLCMHDAVQAFKAARTLLGLLDTRDDLADLETRRHWVLAVQIAATSLARYLEPETPR